MTVYMGVLRYMDMMDAIRRQARRGLLFLFPFCLVSCYEPVTLDLEEEDPVLVVETPMRASGACGGRRCRSWTVRIHMFLRKIPCRRACIEAGRLLPESRVRLIPWKCGRLWMGMGLKSFIRHGRRCRTLFGWIPLRPSMVSAVRLCIHAGG